MGFSGAIFKSFKDIKDAEMYLKSTSNLTDSEYVANNKNKNDNVGDELTKNNIIAYVDGSFDPSTNRYSCGVVLLFLDENGKQTEKHISKIGTDESILSMRNVAGEILGSQLAMEYAIKNNFNCINIYHDYQGISSWCTGEWQAKKDGTKNYRKYYLSALDKIKIDFIKVKGHSNCHYNDIADKLAKEALGI